MTSIDSAYFEAVPVSRHLAFLCVFIALAPRAFAETAELTAAIQSITASDLRGHVSALADDTFEGREAGSRGGRAAGLYLVKQFQKYGLPGGVSGKYYQPFSAYSNILAVLEGSDPELKNQYLVVGAHYDHVGYGTRRNSYGPTGYIHNGADDNASGVAGLMEVAQAFAEFGSQPKRSVLFCLWDGEEKGLYGSKHWLDNPTVPLDKVALAFNADMIGRLRNKRLEVLGIRTAPGLRKLVSLSNDDPDLSLFFNWELKENSDHYPFVQKRIPVVMFHTGLHSDYHRPSDDLDKINADGMQQAARLLFRFLDRAADESQLGKFRAQSRLEGPGAQQALDRPLPPLPGRFGITWDEKQAAEGKIVVTRVTGGSPADSAGIKSGDRLVDLAGRAVASAADVRAAVLVAKNPAEATLERPGATEPLKVVINLVGSPVRLGLSWRTDNAEPNALIVNRVVPGSPADVAGLRVNDRILAAAGSDVTTTDAFQSLVATSENPVELSIESEGKPRTLFVQLPPRE